MKKINGHYIRGERYRELPSPFWNLEETKKRKLTTISTLNINKTFISYRYKSRICNEKTKEKAVTHSDYYLAYISFLKSDTVLDNTKEQTAYLFSSESKHG